jgi:hypothetical protein
MSAYLRFANERRGEVKAQNPDSSNGEISKILSDMWKVIPDELRKEFKEDEQSKWAAYKIGMQEWRKSHDGRKKTLLNSNTAMDDVVVDDIDGLHHRHGRGAKKRRLKHNASATTTTDVDFGEVVDNDVPGFDDHQLGLTGMDPSGNPNPEEMMAASALRGVRGGPHLIGMGGGGGDSMFSQHSANGYSTWFGMTGGSSMNNHTHMPAGNATGAPHNTLQTTVGSYNHIPQQPQQQQPDLSGYSYHSYGSYPNPVVTGNHQAMMMAQLRGGPPSHQHQFPSFLCKFTCFGR